MRKSPLLAVTVLLAVLAIAGCSTDAPRPTHSMTPPFVPVIFSGTQAGGKVFTAPPAARSATITVVCGGDSFFTLTGALDDESGGVSGQCNWGGYEYELAVPKGQKLDLELELQSGGSFVVETRFSAGHYATDREVSRQCSVMVTVGSDVANAEDGYTRGEVSVADWHTRVSAAVTALNKLDPEKPNILSGPLKDIRQALTATGIAPGSINGGSGARYYDSLRIVGQVCTANGSPIYVLGEFGG